MFTIKMCESQSIIRYLARIEDLKKQLIIVDESVVEKEIIAITIKGLASSYWMFVTGLTTTGRLATIGFEELSRMLHHEQQTHDKED